MGGVCSVRRTGDRSTHDVGDGGAPPSYFDVAWDEEYAPISNVTDNLGGIGMGSSGDSGDEGGAGKGVGAGAAPRWPALAEEHLTRLYSNDNGYRTRQEGGREPLSLVELCVRAICRRLCDFGQFPALLPREVVDALLDSLTQHRALSPYALGAFRECELTSLSLGECRGVRNGWLRKLLGDTPCSKFLVSLNLSSCAGLTDAGLSRLPALRSLESASLRHCKGLGSEATLCLSNSPSLEMLSLAHCPLLDDAAVGNLAGLLKLRSLELEGCENVTDEGLRLVCGLPSLTCLNASRCHGITLEGLIALELAASRLKRLNLGWCLGLRKKRSGPLDDLRGAIEEEDEDDEQEEGDVERGEGGG